jgi:hypothetical protein
LRGQGRDAEFAGQGRLVDVRIGGLEAEFANGVVPRGVGDRDPHRQRLDLFSGPPDLLADEMRRGFPRQDSLGGNLLPRLISLGAILDGE